jgi:hypothetical protein
MADVDVPRPFTSGPGAFPISSEELNDANDVRHQSAIANLAGFQCKEREAVRNVLNKILRCYGFREQPTCLVMRMPYAFLIADVCRTVV